MSSLCIDKRADLDSIVQGDIPNQSKQIIESLSDFPSDVRGKRNDVPMVQEEGQGKGNLVENGECSLDCL
jgi:hypothetical protein